MKFSLWNGLSNRARLLTAGALAFFIGVPLTEKAFGQFGSILFPAIDLGFGIASASDGS